LNFLAALAIAKTIFPETNTSKAQWDDIKNLPKGYIEILVIFCKF
jgi:hypothetical protein